jgi:hypothetical protein
VSNLTKPPIAHWAAQFALLLLVALILRCDTFGDPNMHGDETFYFTVGNFMHQGALPYVDVWDRKPFGLFAIYYLIAGISPAPLAYELISCLFAAGTAAIICIIARTWTTVQGGLLAGVCYLLWLGPLQGYGGQSPVFYNLFIAAAALLALRALPQLRVGIVPKIVPLAMLLAGMGVTIKTTALPEAAFIGLLCLSALWQSQSALNQKLRCGITWALIGAAPTLLIAGTYWGIGHWSEFWHAMITSNLSKPPHWPTSRLRMGFMLMALSPILLIATFGLLTTPREGRKFVSLWILAAVLGLFSMPNFYLHYAMPILVPLCIGAAAVLARGITGLVAVAAIALLSFQITPPFNFNHTRQSQQAMADLTHAVQAHGGGKGMLLFDAPPYLHVTTGKPFMTPLVFPTHFAHLIEKDVSHLSTLAELKRVLALKPGVLVMAVKLRNGPDNEEAHQLALAYVGRNCRLIKVVPTLELQREDMIAVWGDCGKVTTTPTKKAPAQTGAFMNP